MKFPGKFIYAASVLPFLFSFQAAADEVISDDLIVNGSECVGFGCAEGEIFGFDTLKLKSDNPQIRFVDTSNSQNFPTSDWTMGVADSVTDTSVFYINDADADTAVLKLSASASGGVALGAGSELIDNTVSVGAADAERRITHVADGIEDTDAVNVRQFEQFQTDIDAELTGLEDQLGDLVTRIDDLSTRLDNL